LKPNPSSYPIDEITLQRIFEVYGFACAFFLASRPLSDGDFWWHLKTGEYIIRTGLIPTTDPFSFTNYGKPWVAHEWMSEAIFYLVYSRLGFNALIFTFAVLTSLAFWIVLRRVNSNPFIAVFATVLGVWTVLPTIGVRPRVFTLLLTGMYLALLTRYARRCEGRGIWWLIPLMALWVNLHGGFLIGLVLIGLTIIGILLDAWATGEKFTSLWPRLRTLGLVLMGCILVVNLNPQGPRIYLFPFEIFLSPVQQQAVNDWLSPDFHQRELLPLALLILLTIAALGLSPRRARPSELLLFLTTLYATLKSTRHMAIFALVAAPLMADYLESWLGSTSFGKRFAPSHLLRNLPLAFAFGLALVLPLMVMTPKLISTVYGPPRQETTKVPQKAVEYMKANQMTGNTFTFPNIWGGYVIWEMPSNPVYIDGRIDMYGDEFVNEFVEITRGLRDWDEPFDRYGVQNVVVRTGSALARDLKESAVWKQVFQDEIAVVYNRR
jgi:hypothetical protein